MKLLSLSTGEKVGFAIGYLAAFVVDSFLKIGTARFAYRKIGWIATKTKIPTPSAEVLFERAVDSVLEAY